MMTEHFERINRKLVPDDRLVQSVLERAEQISCAQETVPPQPRRKNITGAVSRRKLISVILGAGVLLAAALCRRTVRLRKGREPS